MSDTPVRAIDPRPRPESVAAVIVTYHPDAGVAGRIVRLVGQVGAIVVVDNGSEPDELVPVATLARDGVVTVINNPMNEGLATALNQGTAWADARGYAWVLTLDQDTTPGPDVVTEAAYVFDSYPTLRPAVIGALYGLPNADASDDADAGQETACVITAGALHSVTIWRSLGGFRDDFFIDFVDTEYCLRARAAGYAVLRTSRPTISHAIGRPTRHRTVLRSFTTQNHDRTRRYYITRNRILVWRTYARREPGYIKFDMKASAKEFVKLVLVEDDRWGKLVAVARGAFDGLRGRTGAATTPRRRSSRPRSRS